jgi:RimJ/RimL family protein N-acetyltransferase
MLRGNLVNLRLINEDDLAFVIEANQELKLYSDQYYPIQIRSEHDILNNFSNNAFWAANEGMMLIEAKDGRIIGEIEFFRSSPCMAGFEIGFVIYLPKDRNKGYMKEAVRLFSAYLFASKNIPRLTSLVIKENTAGIKLMESCGYKKEGEIRNAAFHRGVYRNYAAFGMIREEAEEIESLLT